MSPGSYLRKRREAAGISLDLAAVAFLPWPATSSSGTSDAVRAVASVNLIDMVRNIATRISEIESDQRFVDSIITSCLARIVPLDVEIYDRLVAVRHGLDVAVPQICRKCAWSWAVSGSHFVERGIPGCLAQAAVEWSATDPDLCTACEHKAAAAQQETADAS